MQIKKIGQGYSCVSCGASTEYVYGKASMCKRCIEKSKRINKFWKKG